MAKAPEMRHSTAPRAALCASITAPCAAMCAPMFGLVYIIFSAHFTGLVEYNEYGTASWIVFHQTKIFDRIIGSNYCKTRKYNN